MRLLMSFALLGSALLIVFGALFYSYAKNNAMKQQQESTHKVLNQVKYNVDHLYDTVLNLTINTFSNRDIAVLMQSPDIDIFELYNRLQKFDYIVNSNLYLDSIVIYNAYNGCYYVSPEAVPVQCEAAPDSNPLQQYRSRHSELPNLKLVPSRVSENQQDRQLLSMFKQEQNSVLMVNVKPQWLFDNVNAINGLTDSMLGEVMILDADDNVLTDAGGGKEDAARGELLDKLRLRSDPEGSFTIGGGRDKKIVMYSTSAATGWKLVGVQSYRVVFGSLQQIGTFSLLLISAFVLLSLAASTAISMRLYKPIGTLIREVRGIPAVHDGLGGGQDELSYLTSFNRRMLEKMAKLETGKKATETIAKDYVLRRLLFEKREMSDQEFAGEARQHGLRLIESGGAYAVCLLRIAPAVPSGNSNDWRLLPFAVQNIAVEIAGGIALCESLLLDEAVALLLSVPEEEAAKLAAELPGCLGRIQEVVRNYYRIGVGASISSVVRDHGRIADAYGQALLQFEYRMIFGKSALITPELVAANERSEETQLDDSAEKKWLACVRSANWKAIEPQLVQLFRQLSTFRHDRLLQSVQYLTAITVNHLKEMNLDDSPSLKATLLSFNRRVLEQETLDDVMLVYMELFRQIAESRGTNTEEKNRILAAALKESVEKHYADPNLSLQFLAAKLKMSTAHLSKVFKQSEHISLNDYINKVRIRHTVEELERTDHTIAQIMSNVGFVSESYFYKVFKQSTGLTPREYRTKRMLDKD